MYMKGEKLYSQSSLLVWWEFSPDFFASVQWLDIAGLNSPQVNQINKQNDSPTSTYTQLVPSKLVTASNVRVQYVVQMWPNYPVISFFLCKHIFIHK